MNGRIVGTKPLYVALAQRKEERKAILTNQYMQRLSTMRTLSNPLLGSFQQPSSYFLPAVPQVIGLADKEPRLKSKIFALDDSGLMDILRWEEGTFISALWVLTHQSLQEPVEFLPWCP